jgi:hypothetical protein
MTLQSLKRYPKQLQLQCETGDLNARYIGVKIERLLIIKTNRSERSLVSVSKTQLRVIIYISGPIFGRETFISLNCHFAKMQGRKRVAALTLLAILLEINCADPSSEGKCIDYFKTEEIFDLSALEGPRYAVYYWPPNQRQRDRCEVINFVKITDVRNINNECRYLDLSNETVIQATYTNSAGKHVKLYYYGNDVVKNLYRSCNRIAKYIYRRIDDNYIMGINCSSGGRGVLLSKVLPTSSEVQSVVDGIDIMTGREGTPDCALSRR